MACAAWPSWCPTPSACRKEVSWCWAACSGSITRHRWLLSLVKRGRDLVIGIPALLIWQTVESRRAFHRKVSKQRLTATASDGDLSAKHGVFLTRRRDMDSNPGRRQFLAAAAASAPAMIAATHAIGSANAQSAKPGLQPNRYRLQTCRSITMWRRHT